MSPKNDNSPVKKETSEINSDKFIFKQIKSINFES